MAIRYLYGSEITLAQLVFQNSINLTIVRIQNDLGLGNRPWTSPPAPGVPFFILHVGSGYSGMATSTRRTLFIHELTHVWQGQHGFLYGYVFNSALHQTLSFIFNGGQVSQAYGYSPGLRWSQYATEQQASIVADWYSPYIGKQSTGDSRYRYIRDNIRPGNPWA